MGVTKGKMRTHDEAKLSKALRLFYKKKGATVAEVATSCDVTGRTVERWLRMWSGTLDVVRLGAGRPIRYRVTADKPRPKRHNAAR